MGENTENSSEQSADTTAEPQGFMDEFMAFLQEYGVIGLAIAVVMGNAVNDLTNTIVDGAIMPLIEVALPGDGWREATTVIGPFEFMTGRLIGAMLDFLIIAVLIYAFYRYVLKKEAVGKI